MIGYNLRDYWLVMVIWDQKMVKLVGILLIIWGQVQFAMAIVGPSASLGQKYLLEEKKKQFANEMKFRATK